MPKKRVGVSLRKPSPAPESASPEASVAAVSVAAVSVGPVPVAAVPVFGSLSAPLEVLAAHGNAAVERDPEPLLRESTPAPLAPHAAEAFVSGAAAALERAANELPPAQLRALLQRGPEGYRELTLYLPEKLAEELALHCLEHDLDMNRLVASALQLHLSGAAASTPAPRRRANDLPAQGETLTIAARALLGELGEWVRMAWAERRRRLLSRAGFGAPAS